MKKARVFLIAVLLLLCFPVSVYAGERLEEFAGMIREMDAGAEAPGEEEIRGKKEDKKQVSSNEEKRRTSLSVNYKAVSEDTVSVDWITEDDRLRSFARETEKLGTGELTDDRLIALAKESEKREAEYEKKYGKRIEDHVVRPEDYNDGDRIIRTYPKSSSVKKTTDKTDGNKQTVNIEDDESPEWLKKVNSVRDFFSNLFFGKKKPVDTEEEDRQEYYEADENGNEKLGTFTLTAYCACIICCGKTDGITATGTKAAVGRTIAVDPAVIPLGSRVMIDGHVYTAEDTGGKIKGKRIDIFMNTHEEAKKFGVKSVEVILLKSGVRENQTDSALQ